MCKSRKIPRNFQVYHARISPKNTYPIKIFSGDVNIYRIEVKTFSAYLLMENIYLLTDCGGIKKYF